MDISRYFSPYVETQFTPYRHSIVTLKHTTGSVSLLGTVHNDQHYGEIVQQLIREIKPDIVAVELDRVNLDRYRIHGKRPMPILILEDQEIPDGLKKQAVNEKLLLGLLCEAIRYMHSCKKYDRVQHLVPHSYTKSIKVKPKLMDKMIIGSEFVAPFRNEEWRFEDNHTSYLITNTPGIKYRILLADKPANQMFCGIAKALSENDVILLEDYRRNFTSYFVNSQQTEKRSVLELLLKKNGRLRNAILKERDEFITESLFKAVNRRNIKDDGSRLRILGIFGKNHIKGIVNCWKEKIYNYRLYERSS